MIHILSKHRLNQVSASAAGASEGPSSLQGSSFIEACRQLRTLVEGENSSASFACGGTISIGNIDTEQPSSSPPVNLFWAAREDAQAQKLELPLTDTQQSNPSLLQRLVADCTPATFGRGDQDVLDPNYRMAGKLDPEKFASSFHPADFGILENVEQILLPSVRTDLENCLQHRKITAHLYKLNVILSINFFYNSCNAKLVLTGLLWAIRPLSQTCRYPTFTEPDRIISCLFTM